VNNPQCLQQQMLRDIACFRGIGTRIAQEGALSFMTSSHAQPFSTRLLILACATGILALSTPAATQFGVVRRLETEVVNGREVAAREVLVKLREPGSPARFNQLAAIVDADVIQPLARSQILRIRSRSLNASPLLARLAGRADVEWAEPNYIVRALDETADPMFPQLWGLKNVGQAVNGTSAGLAGADIGAVEAWDTSIGSTSIVVGVVDTGIDYTHPDLESNIWSAPAEFEVTLGGVHLRCAAGTHGFNAIENTCDPMDDHFHGTHVAGTIGAVGNNGVGVVGVNRNTSLMGLKFIDSSGSGTIADAVNAIEFAIQVKQIFAGTGAANVRVLSNSWGGFEVSNALRDQIAEANSNELLFVAAAGNYGIPNDLLPTYPASLDEPNIISVAATTNTDGLASFSNYGLNTVDLGAPGVDILSTVTGGGYAFASGTSMAAPHVSGAAALVLSQCALDTSQLKVALLGSVDPVSSLAAKTTTGGRLNVHSAVHTCTPLLDTPTLSAASGDTLVRLTWSSVVGATGYVVKRSVSAVGPFETLAADIHGREYADVNVVNGTTYYYVVNAKNLVGESADSNVVSATPAPSSDLVIPSVSAPASGGAGLAISLSVTTKNQGVGASPATIIGFYLSPNSTWNATDRLIGNRQLPVLLPGALDTGSISVTIPPDMITGNYYVIAVADPGNEVIESVETNNTKAGSLIRIGPDLIVPTVTAPAAAAAGATISVSSTTKNQGGGSSAAATTRFVLSTNFSVDSSDAVLGTRASPALEPGASEIGVTELTVPVGTVGGTYYVIAVADSDNTVGETTETNNYKASAAIKIGPDLVVSALSVPPTAAAGGTIVVSDTTKNQGSGASATSTTAFFLSSDALLSPTDTLLASRPVAPLGPTAVQTASTSFQIPASTSAGNYYIVARADWEANIPESLENNNNKTSVGIKIGGDLVVTALSGPATAAADAIISVTDSTKNQGAGSIPASATGFHLSTGRVLANAIAFLGTRTVGSLSPGETSTGTSELRLPQGISPGSYYILGSANWDGVLAEANSQNNLRAFGPMSVGPDLVVSTLVGPSTANAGSFFTVTDTTANQGSAAAPASITRYYLSANTLLDANDLFVGVREVSALAAGTNEGGSVNVQIPTTTSAGTHYIIAQADGDSRITEASETNNTRVRYISIKLSSP
jgi:subtilisin family serine protease